MSESKGARYKGVTFRLDKQADREVIEWLEDLTKGKNGNKYARGAMRLAMAMAKTGLVTTDQIYEAGERTDAARVFDYLVDSKYIVLGEKASGGVRINMMDPDKEPWPPKAPDRSTSDLLADIAADKKAAEDKRIAEEAAKIENGEIPGVDF